VLGYHWILVVAVNPEVLFVTLPVAVSFANAGAKGGFPEELVVW